VSYLRALDFVGVVEAIGEVKKGCEDTEDKKRKRILERIIGNQREGEREKVIGDSEDEESSDEQLVEEEEGMTEILVLDNFTNMAGTLFSEMERNSGKFPLHLLFHSIPVKTN